ncbi:MAG: hypothetical protein A4E45_01709 [Methanosaeta sp. PtaB.Bin039]|nr:MAG: hypothetical protein A4E45_01709 [Methanosaeta sp. PtaB.Bin039]HOT07863.1 hypothetical protein [Methanotrichaceae archaeon]HQF17560.1 hypothetical protein [Methanotrichaceae archaeon]HQI92146.1 hypothetical protein [Methanotrichaceae archaeon]
MTRVQILGLALLMMLVPAESLLTSSESISQIAGRFYYLEDGRYLWAGIEPLHLDQTPGTSNPAALYAFGPQLRLYNGINISTESRIGSLASAELAWKDADYSVIRGPYPVLLNIDNPFWVPSWYVQGRLWSLYYQQRHWSDDLFGDTDHIQAIEEFRRAGWRPVPLGYENHIPALGEFMTRGTGQRAPADLSQHIPAIKEFLSDDWTPPGPPDSQTYPGLAEFLRD